MILKKPYAFLIKYFRIINIILAVLAGYVARRTYGVITFFNDYVVNNYTGNIYKGFSTEYISPIFYLAIVVLLVGIIGITLLFIYKKKPTKAYIASIGYYIILIIFLNIVSGALISLEKTVMTAEAARIYRDLSLLSVLPQIYFILLFLFRGLGFNIKKFNFDKDIKELEVAEGDNDEVEVTFKNDGVKLRRLIRRFGREFVYYLKENLLMAAIFGAILLCVALYFASKSAPKNYDKTYKQGVLFNNGEMSYRFEDSIVTNLDYRGNKFSDDEYYLVARVYIENNSMDTVNLDSRLFRLIYKREGIYPSTDKAANFSDYGDSCFDKTVLKDSSRSCLLVYRLTKKQIKKNYKIKIQNGTAYSQNVRVAKYNYVNITPAIIENIITQKEVKAGEELSFETSSIGNVKIKLSNPLVTTKYVYDYEFCNDRKVCNKYKNVINIDYTLNNKVLMIFDYEFSSESKWSLEKIFELFSKFRYKNDNEYEYITVKNVTPKGLKNKIVLETSSKIKDSDGYDLLFVIRNKEYIINIK